MSTTEKTFSTSTLRILIVITAATVCQGQMNKPPEFLRNGDMARLSVREDTPIGTNVYQLRALDPEGSRITYEMTSDYLEVDGETGIVKTTKALDRERSSTAAVIIRATDEKLYGTTPNTIELKQEVTILDVNDNAPRFQQLPYAFTVNETTSAGVVLFSGIYITDADAGTNAEVTLSCVKHMVLIQMSSREPEQNKLEHVETLQSPQACDTFGVSIERESPGKYRGMVFLKSKLNYAQSSRHLLTIEAADLSASNQLTSRMNVAILVLDSQDRPPQFLNGPYFAAVSEETPSGVPVLTVQVQDGDRGNARPLKLAIIDDGGHFRLSEPTVDSDNMYSVVIETSDKPLDREDPAMVASNGQYTFRIKAVELEQDNGQPTSTESETTITILVTDIDDHPPVIAGNKHLTIEVAEDIGNGSFLSALDIWAEDLDMGDNGHYTLTLDSEDDSKNIFAVQHGSGHGRSPVPILVADVTKLDYETAANRHLTFQVIVTGDNGQQDRATVHVTVTDANDHEPVFDQDKYDLEVNENSPAGTIVATVTATDADDMDTDRLDYALQGSGAEWFTVNRSTGEIAIADCGAATCLDHEKTSTNFLMYTAKDTWGHANIVRISVNVVDVNDNAPTFSQKEFIRNTQVETIEFVPPLQIQATDKDSSKDGNNNVTYRIVESDAPNGTIDIHRTTGNIELLRPLTSSSSSFGHGKKSLTIQIEAADNGEPQLTDSAVVVVTLTETQTEDLYFVHPLYNASVSETAREGTKVAQVMAIDTENDAEAILYRIVSGAMDDFDIDPMEGIISLAPNATLDLEHSPDEYTVVIEGISGKDSEPKKAMTVVHITVEDVNNKPPSFLQDFYVAHVSEGASSGSVVLQVQAVDPDKDHLLQYSIVDPVTARDRTGVLIAATEMLPFQEAFQMNSSTGEIVLKSPVKSSEVSVVYLRVKVTDRNAVDVDTEQSATTEIMIYVVEEKDENPAFPPPWSPSNPQIEFSIPEEPTIMSTLFTLTAKNPMGNGPISFKLLNGSDNPHVVLDEQTGAVTLIRRLDFEELPPHARNIIFTVQAVVKGSDGSNAHSNATVIINVQDINDNSPVFADQSHHVSVPESTTHPQVITTLQASDKDRQFSFGDIRYSLDGDGADVFAIDPLTGALSLAKDKHLDRETKVLYHLRVTAKDNPKGNGNQRRASTLVVIDVLDVNDNAPEFHEPLYQAIIPETVAPGFNIRQVQASDRDTGASSQIMYSLGRSTDLGEYLKVNDTTGMLAVSKALSGKGRSEPYKVIVEAADHGHPRLSTEVHVLLFITDVSSNDGVPTIVRPRVDEHIQVPENSPSGTFVYRVEAFDPDNPTSDGGFLRYSFLGDGSSGADERFFAIDPLKGTITTRTPLDRETRDTYKVVVIVRDTGFPPQQTSRSLVIAVTDVDDHEPQFLRPKNYAALDIDLQEEVATDTVVTYVEATDNDIGDDAVIHYHILAGNEDGALSINQTERGGMIYVSGRIDREQKDSYELTIRATPPPPSPPIAPKDDHRTYTYDPMDRSMVQVRIRVVDIDDNPPMFLATNETTGIRTNVLPGTRIFSFKAIDYDATPSTLTYEIKDCFFHSVATGKHLESNCKAAFELNELTGSLRTVTPMTHYENGYFVLQVMVTSNNQTATTFLTVFVLRGKELLKFVFDRPLAEVKKSLNDFQSELQNTIQPESRLTVNLYDSHFGAQEMVANVSSLCFQFVSGDDVMSNSEAESLLNLLERPRLGVVYRNYGVQSVENCAVEGQPYTMTWMEITILAIGLLIAMAAVVCAFLVCHSHRRYTRKMHRTMYQVMSGGNTTSDTNGNGYSTIDRQRIHEWRERSRPTREQAHVLSYS